MRRLQAVITGWRPLSVNTSCLAAGNCTGTMRVWYSGRVSGHTWAWRARLPSSPHSATHRQWRGVPEYAPPLPVRTTGKDVGDGQNERKRFEHAISAYD